MDVHENVYESSNTSSVSYNIIGSATLAEWEPDLEELDDLYNSEDVMISDEEKGPTLPSRVGLDKEDNHARYYRINWNISPLRMISPFGI